MTRAALSVGQILGPVPPCQQGDHASDGDGPGEHGGADPGSGGQCAPADGAQYFCAPTVPYRLETRPSSAAGTWRWRMVTAVRLNRAQAALLANSITDAMITLAVSPS